MCRAGVRSTIAGLRCIATVATFVVSLLLLRGVGASGAEFRFEENVSWIGSIGARYHVAVDGISLWLVLLTTLLMPIAVLSSWTAIRKRQLSYYVFLLILESAMIGVFVSLDLLLFYLFFEASLVPMFFLIGIWGGERRIYAAVKFFIYTAVGSLLMLVGIIALYFTYHTFDYPTLLQAIDGESASRSAPSTGCFSRLHSRSVSRCRCSRFTPGCRTRTPKRPLPVR